MAKVKNEKNNAFHTTETRADLEKEMLQLVGRYMLVTKMNAHRAYVAGCFHSLL